LAAFARLRIALAWANLFGLVVAMLVRRLEFTSIWCFYAAVVSVILYFFSDDPDIAAIRLSAEEQGCEGAGLGFVAPRSPHLKGEMRGTRSY
jgi:hypothetical protein